MPPLD